MPVNTAGLALTAATLRASLLYAQLHSASAGDGTSNIAIAARQPVTWSIISSTEFALLSQLEFTDGTPGGPAYSVTLWDAETDGNCYAECLLSGDNVFNSEGKFLVTQIDFLATSTDA